MWQKGDSENASKNVLNNSYYLTDELCMGGNEAFPKSNGNRTEHGNIGNDYAKNTLL